MEPYAPIPGAGPFAASMSLFTALVADLQAPEAAGLTACELEELLAGRGRQVLRQPKPATRPAGGPGSSWSTGPSTSSA